jgi:copper chaperone
VDVVSSSVRNTPGGYTLCGMTTITYSVPGVHCAHCEQAIKTSVSAVEGVESIDVDLDTKLVTVRGSELSDESLRAAIDDAGYDVAA